MKRAIVLALSVILALVVAAPTVLARSDNGTAPEPVRAIDFIVEAGALHRGRPLRLRPTARGERQRENDNAA